MKREMIAVLCLFLLGGCSEREALVLKSERFLFELGEPVSANVQYYLENTEDKMLEKIILREARDENSFVESSYVIDQFIHSKDKEYLAVGEYYLEMVYRNEVKKFMIQISDTMAPKITLMNEIVLKQGETPDYKSYFQCEDFSRCELSYNDSSIDIHKAGNYTLSVRASDVYDNTVQEDFAVHVESSKSAVPPIQNAPMPLPAENEQNSWEKVRDDLAYQVLDIVNQERQKAGMKALSWDDNLRTGAEIRTSEIEILFKHQRPDGSNVFSAIPDSSAYVTLGENIAMGRNAYKTADSVMQGWMNSEGHKTNILDPGFDSLGVGCFQKSDGSIYWVQLFGGK